VRREQPPDILGYFMRPVAPASCPLKAERFLSGLEPFLPNTLPEVNSILAESLPAQTMPLLPMWARMFHAKIAKLLSASRTRQAAATTGRGALSRYPRRTRYFPAVAAGFAESSPLGGWRATQGKAKGKRSEVSGCAGINRHVAGDARALQERSERLHPDPESCGRHREVTPEA